MTDHVIERVQHDGEYSARVGRILLAGNDDGFGALRKRRQLGYTTLVRNGHETLEERLTQRFEAEPAGIVSVYLFGSRAAGRAHRESDIDIGVLFDWDGYPDRRGRFEAGLRLAGRLMSAAGSSVDVVILNDAPPHFTRHILSSGRRLFCANAEADHAFARTVLLRAADLEPFLRRMRSLKLAALAR